MDSRFEGMVNKEARLQWSAAVLAGLIAGAVVLLLSHGLPWFTSGMVSPTLMGRDLKPAGLVEGSRSALTILLQAAVSVAYALIIAPLVFQLRGMWAAALGGLVGLGLYALNYSVFHFLLRSDWTGTEIPVLVTHIIFGMFAAALYKGFAARRHRRADLIAG